MTASSTPSSDRLNQLKEYTMDKTTYVIHTAYHNKG